MVYKRPSRAGHHHGHHGLVSGVRRPGISSCQQDKTQLLTKSIKETTALKKANLISKKHSLKQIEIAKATVKRMNRQLAINKDYDLFKAQHAIKMIEVNHTLCQMKVKWDAKFGDEYYSEP